MITPRRRYSRKLFAETAGPEANMRRDPFPGNIQLALRSHQSHLMLRRQHATSVAGAAKSFDGCGQLLQPPDLLSERTTTRLLGQDGRHIRTFYHNAGRMVQFSDIERCASSPKTGSG
jgi:hypothetical protein